MICLSFWYPINDEGDPAVHGVVVVRVDCVGFVEPVVSNALKIFRVEGDCTSYWTCVHKRGPPAFSHWDRFVRIPITRFNQRLPRTSQRDASCSSTKALGIFNTELIEVCNSRLRSTSCLRLQTPWVRSVWSVLRLVTYPLAIKICFYCM